MQRMSQGHERAQKVLRFARLQRTSNRARHSHCALLRSHQIRDHYTGNIAATIESGRHHHWSRLNGHDASNIPAAHEKPWL